MQTADPLLDQVDHLVYAAPDLAAAVTDLERRLGVRATEGGRHPGRGTRNALLALGPSCYLEIVAPDPDQPAPPAGRWFGVDDPRGARLVAWAAKGSALSRRVEEAAQRGVRLGAVESGARRRPDGGILTWQFTDPATVVANGLVPFLIDWGASPHPAATAARGAVLAALRAEHPDPGQVQQLLRAVGVDLPVERGPSPVLIATVESPRGPLEIR